MKYRAVVLCPCYLFTLGLAVELRQRRFSVAIPSNRPETLDDTVLYFLPEEEIRSGEENQVNVIPLLGQKGKGLYFGADNKEVCEYLDKVVKNFTKEEDTVFLNEREEAILERILAGKSNRDIAADLFLSEKTIKNNITVLYTKLDVKNRQEVFSKFSYFF
ncbi:MAG: LuxR C-terminal-related transcriptional regulator [Tissierellia bacterium]|nr:LuxR C-terminal-related transcriptional regulator [Tissierellia bacterium]